VRTAADEVGPTPEPAGAAPPAGAAIGGGREPRPKRRRRNAQPHAGLVAVVRFAILAGLLGLWELGYRTGHVDAFSFSAPTLVWERGVKLFARESLIGLALGFVAGVSLGFVAGLNNFVGQLLEPVMLLLNSVPRIVLAPMFILWFGIGEKSKVASAFFLVFVVIFFAVATGLREVAPNLVAAVRVLGGGRWALIREVYVPSVLTWVFSSLRITVGFAFTGAVVAEVISSTEGLGYLLNQAQSSFDASLMMATVVIIMIMIMLIFAVLSRIEAHLMRWKKAR
jgi:NitT/TauT family transport system permease protein